LVPVHSVQILVPGGDADDLFAAANLTEELGRDGIQAVGGPVDLSVTLYRESSPGAKAVLASEHLAFDPAMHDEGYVVVAKAHSVDIVGQSAAGVFYGVQTLKQMLILRGHGAALWTGTVRDWPAMKVRGVHDDLSRGPFPTLAFQKHQLDVFASRKINLYSPYFEHTLAYSGEPLAAPPGGSLSRDDARELVAYATRLHITVVPEQEAFGHLHHVLQYEKYSDLAETPHGHVLAPGQTGSLPLIGSWFWQIAEDFPSPYLHIGADETFELGTGRTKDDVTKRGLGPVYADFLRAIHSQLAPLGRRLLFWGDVAWSDASAIAGLPKDMIAIPWIYWHEDSYDANITPFAKVGMETWVTPGDANWNVVYPLGKTALDNISGFVEAGQRLGSAGEMTAVWDDDGEGLFNLDWYGVLFSAAAGWEPAKKDLTVLQAEYVPTFGATFYNDGSGRIDEAQGELLATESGPDAVDNSDLAFWLDPFSEAGAKWYAKFGARVPAARKHAERAIELIEFVKADTPGLREREALDAMEMAARRIDLIGMKAQLAAEMESAYRRAYELKDDKSHAAEARELLYSISSMNGRCQDLRDAYSMLKGLYRQAWLAENRPYWLDNVLVRYDLRIELWQKRGEEFNTIMSRWQDGRGLPTAADAGFPAVP
jgi:hypothetical protein